MISTFLKLDEKLFFAIANTNQRRKIGALAKLISKTGDGPTYLLLAVISALMTSMGLELLLLMLMAFAIELPIYFVVKNWVKRPRPFKRLGAKLALIKPSDEFSLPSGHTAAASIMAGSIFMVYPLLFVPACIWAGFIALSRVILGVHYPSDLLAGLVLGIASLWCALQFIG